MSGYWLGIGSGFLCVALADSLAPRPHTSVVVIMGLVFVILALVCEVASARSRP